MSVTQQESKMFSEAKHRYSPVNVKRRWLNGIAYVGEFLDSSNFHLSLSWRKQNLSQKNINLNKAFKEREKDKLVMAPVITNSLTFCNNNLYFYSKKEKQI